MSFKVIGQRLVRKDQVAKATGIAQYTVDVQFPDTLHCVTLKSPHAHALINDIDTSEAEKLHLMGTKPSCNRGACGACTVILDGVAVLSCMTLTADCHNKSVVTIEGLGTPDHLHPIQEAFIENNGSQCGFCTPGMIVAAKALLDKNPDPSVDEIKSGLANNTCRCGNYSFITRAVLSAAKKLKER